MAFRNASFGTGPMLKSMTVLYSAPFNQLIKTST